MKDEWTEFVDFAWEKKSQHELLFPADIEKDVFDQLLSFHFLHKNLYMAKDGDEWSFGVMRPIEDPFNPWFNWEQKEGDFLLLDFLYCKSKKTCLRLWNMFCKNVTGKKMIVYHRRGKTKRLTKELVLKFFAGLFNK
jgi:hypothetical protein